MTAMMSLRPAWGPTTPVAAGLIGATAAAWILLLAGGHLTAATPTHVGRPHPMSDAHTMPVDHPLHHEGVSLTGHAGAWTLMTVAMMTLGLLPVAQSWRARTLRRRWWATPTILAGYYLFWILAGVLVFAAVGAHRPNPLYTSGLLLVAAAWQLTPTKRWAGHRSPALRLRGLAATTSEIWGGLRHGATCMLSCWAVMVPMAIGAQPMGVLVVVGTTTVTAERLSRRPRRTRRLTAALLATSAIGTAVLSLP